nr:SUMF1/EgtB/PvdO family nonheme iron enzyme [Providencia burhodogranariea]
MKKITAIMPLSIIVFMTSGCDNSQKEAEAAQLRQTSFDNMVPIKGGRFQMGDFGPLIDEDKLPLSTDPSTRPLHWVSLSDFSMGKYRVTWAEFNRWLTLQGRDKTEYYLDVLNNPYAKKDKISDNYPASVSWQDAKDYCQWLGQNSGRKTDLPTEAQWEYAARSGGELLIYANSDNKMHSELDPARNFTGWIAPVGNFAPNPIGLYDMMGNGVDWVNDWYSEDYYQHSPEHNPLGAKAEISTKKVIRGHLGSFDGIITIARGKDDPNMKFGYQFRCVENR